MIGRRSAAAAVVACLLSLGVAQLGCAPQGAPDTRADAAPAPSRDLGGAASSKGVPPSARADLAPSSAVDSRSSSADAGPVEEFRTPYYVLDIPESEVGPGYTVEYDESVLDFEECGKGGRRTYVYTSSSGDEPYVTILMCTEGWIGLQRDQGVATDSVAFEVTDEDGTTWRVMAVGGPYGDYGPMTLEESLEFTRLWASRVHPVAS
ncbi:MAG: hypothetical protein KHY83_06570 [Coriobacteriia bacterium]|nr:hypothetical protein [Coriobacteriia bacterium]MBS5478311.1 hypothetical protein [Coriobacteriia bacterium]